MPSCGVCLSVYHVRDFYQAKSFTSFHTKRHTCQYADGGPPNGGVECRWGWHKSRFWTIDRWLLDLQATATDESTVHIIIQTATPGADPESWFGGQWQGYGGRKSPSKGLGAEPQWGSESEASRSPKNIYVMRLEKPLMKRKTAFIQYGWR